MAFKLLLAVGLVFLMRLTAATADNTLPPADLKVPPQARNSIGDEANKVQHLVETLKNLIEQEDGAAEVEGGASMNGLDADPPVEVMEEYETEEEERGIDGLTEEEEEEREMSEELAGETSIAGLAEEALQKVRHVAGGGPQLVRVCEGQTLTISCPAGQQIHIVSALYGRTSRDFCPHSSIRTTSCQSTNSLARVRTSCQGKSSCSVRASNSVFGDPCVHTFKYLEVRYTCTDLIEEEDGAAEVGGGASTNGLGGPQLVRVCEGQTLTISCPAGQQIHIVSALYGRTSREFCPHSSIRTTSCQSANSLARVRTSCQGKSSCSVRASNGVFGDPCVHTFKYLEVRYTCTGQPTTTGSCSGWTRWYDRDDPSATGDWELLSNLRQENPGQICAAPSGIQARVKGANTPASQTGRQFYRFDPQVGFVCRNNDQNGNRCLDYEVRFWCP